MSAIEDFKKVVKEAIASNKLSSSRVEAVKKASARCLDRAQLARSQFLKLHLGAPASSKIVSLYLFDAIVRHARDIIKKDGAGTDIGTVLPSVAKAAHPKAALVSAAKEFMKEMATAVQEVAEDTAKTVRPDQKEKVIKVIDIWRKAETFDSSLLSSVANSVRAVESRRSTPGPVFDNGLHDGHNGKGLNRSTTPTSDPPQGAYGTASGSGAASSTGAAPGLPASLAALLGANAPQQQSTQPQAQAGGAQSFMDSLNSLTGARGQQHQQAATSGSGGATAGPSFDLSQLTALQQYTQQNHQPPPTAASSSTAHQPVAQFQSSSLPSGAPAPSTSYTQSSAAQSTSATWPPQPDSSVGDLSSFDTFSFDPTRADSWRTLAQKWANTYGNMPAVVELGMNFLMFHQQAQMMMMMQQQQQQQQQQGGGGNAMGGSGGMGGAGQYGQAGQSQGQGWGSGGVSGMM